MLFCYTFNQIPIIILTLLYHLGDRFGDRSDFIQVAVLDFSSNICQLCILLRGNADLGGKGSSLAETPVGLMAAIILHDLHFSQNNCLQFYLERHDLSSVEKIKESVALAHVTQNRFQSSPESTEMAVMSAGHFTRIVDIFAHFLGNR